MKKFIGIILGRSRREEGQAMVLAALMMVVLLGFAAFAVDFGYVSVQKTDLQNAADAAALAGVVDLPSTANAVGTAVAFAKSNGMDITANNVTHNTDKVVITPLSGNRLEVVCTRQVDYFFAVVLGFETTTVSARAVAQKDPTAWSGEALPFVNTNIRYTNGMLFDIRDKGGSGQFDSIDKVDRGDKLQAGYWAFDIQYEDGLLFKKGIDNSVHKEIQDIYNDLAASGSRTVYLFSLSNEVMASGQVKLTAVDKNGQPIMRSLASLKTNDNINKDQLVLIRCTFDACQDNSMTMKLTITGLYDLGNGYKDSSGNNLPDYPTDFESPLGNGAGARLVE